jgi:hypothetical protein
MPGQWSNFRKNFEKAFNLAEPYINVAKRLAQAAMIGGNVFWNMNKLDDPNLTHTEKGKAIFNVITAPLAAVPGVGTVVSWVADAAEYVSDVISEKKILLQSLLTSIRKIILVEISLILLLTLHNSNNILITLA